MKPLKLVADMARERPNGPGLPDLRPLLKTRTVMTALATIVAGILMPILERYGVVLPKTELVAILGALLAIFLRSAIRTEGNNE